jgi:hypothetical protein
MDQHIILRETTQQDWTLHRYPKINISYMFSLIYILFNIYSFTQCNL